MNDDIFNLNELKRVKQTIQKVSKKEKTDIAVIGMFGRIGLANNLQEYWDALKEGKNFIRTLPVNRFKDAIGFSIKPIEKEKMIEASYFDEIDKFDYEFFNISLREAKMMDPNQRIFLESAWSVLEESGYGGENIKGSKTGVFVGHSNDLRVDYHTYVYGKNKESYKDISLAGNIKSIIASRIAYILDLKGPSMIVDTACSSTLVAIHLACQSLRNGECEMAIAGGIKINILPIERGIDDDAGIRSPHDITRSFDNDADGISSGEGVCTLLLKPLDKAILDGDNIRAIIKGSAINQDGNSIGLTAPNDEAQKDVILDAWRVSEINPESISHIESHGTGTKLGDPVEISGIEKAFRNYTDKNAFCSIGSNKPNVGHLDNASGMASIMKLLLMIQHREIPPLINFERPNSKINFIKSPLYINDRFNKWKPESNILRCGVSSFGLSGTNCHLVLEEYINGCANKVETYYKRHIFTLSAREDYILKDLVEKYIKSIDEDSKDFNIADICYTTNVGRRHNNYRLAFIVGSKAELKGKLKRFLTGDKSLEDDYFYGFNKLVSSKKKNLESYELDEIEKNQIDNKAYKLIDDVIKDKDGKFLEEICKLYVRGADISWTVFYIGQDRNKVSLPVYPFKKNRCWIESDKNLNLKTLEKGTSLLKGIKLPSIGQTIYVSNFSPMNDWVIGDHSIHNRYVMPGTAYIEMIVEALRSIGVTSSIELKNTVFINQFSMAYEESKDIQVIIKEKDEGYEFVIASLDESESKWNTHSEGMALRIELSEPKRVNMSTMISYMKKDKLIEINEKNSLVTLKGRWQGIKKELYKINDGYLAYIELDHEHMGDLYSYYLHPSLLDRGINAAIDIIDKDSYYLPFNYGELKMYHSLPGSFYSLIIEKDTKSKETATFDVTLFDLKGNILVEVKDYSVKRARVSVLENTAYKNMLFYTGWKRLSEEDEVSSSIDGGVAVIRNSGFKKLNFIDKLRRDGVRVVELELGRKDAFICDSSNRIHIEDYSSIIDLFKKDNLKNIIYVGTPEFGYDLQSVFLLMKEIINKQISKQIKMLFLSQNAFEVTGKELNISPFNNAVASLFNVISQEYENFRCRFLDTSEECIDDIVITELKKSWKNTVVAYRDYDYYYKTLKSCNDLSEDKEDYKLYNEGVYLITGGTGGLALEVAKHLALKKKINIILMSRAKVPERNKWDDILISNEEYKIKRLIKTIREIEKTGSKVDFYSVDVSNKESLELSINEIRNNFGRIYGIVHCAGVAGDGFLLRKSEEDFNNVVSPKIQGTINLDFLTRQDKPDFMVLFSSINSLIGGKGQGDYSAANAFMDGYSIFRNKLGLNTTSINWASWEDVGMAYEYNSYREDELFNTLNVKDALSLFDIVLRNDMSNVVAGQLNKKFFKYEYKEKLPFEIETSIREKIENRFIENKKLKQNNYSEIIISGRNDEELSDVEKHLVNIWAKVLQTNELNIYDSFSSLGGDSILATYLYKELVYKYPGILDITDIFNYSSIHEMAECINKRLKEENEEKSIEKEADDLDNLLNMLANGDISVSEINNILR